MHQYQCPTVSIKYKYIFFVTGRGNQRTIYRYLAVSKCFTSENFVIIKYLCSANKKEYKCKKFYIDVGKALLYLSLLFHVLSIFVNSNYFPELTSRQKILYLFCLGCKRKLLSYLSNTLKRLTTVD